MSERTSRYWPAVVLTVLLTCAAIGHWHTQHVARQVLDALHKRQSVMDEREEAIKQSLERIEQKQK